MIKAVVKCEANLASQVLCGASEETVFQTLNKLADYKKNKKISTKRFVEILKFLAKKNYFKPIIDFIQKNTDFMELVIFDKNETNKALRELYFIPSDINPKVERQSKRKAIIDLFHFTLPNLELATLLFEKINLEFKDLVLNEFNILQICSSDNGAAYFELMPYPIADIVKHASFFLMNESIYQLLKKNKIPISSNLLNRDTPDTLYALILKENQHLVDELKQDENNFNDFICFLMCKGKIKTIEYLSSIDAKESDFVLKTVKENLPDDLSSDIYNLLQNDNEFFNIDFTLNYLKYLMEKTFMQNVFFNLFDPFTDFFKKIDDFTFRKKEKAVLLDKILSKLNVDQVAKQWDEANIDYELLSGYFAISAKYYLANLQKLLLEKKAIDQFSDSQRSIIFNYAVGSNNIPLIKELVLKSEINSTFFSNTIRMCSRGMIGEEILSTIFNTRELKNNAHLMHILSATHSPLVAKILIEIDPEFLSHYSKAKLNELYQIAEFSGDIESAKSLEPYLETKKQHAHPNIPPEAVAVKKDVLKIIERDYGQGLSQAEYRSRQLHMAAIVCHALNNKTFTLMQKKDNNYGEQIDLGLLGKLRQDVAIKMVSDESLDFGRFREKNKLEQMLTPMEGRYEIYLGRFLNDKSVKIFKSGAYDEEEFTISFFQFRNGNINLKADFETKIFDKIIPLTQIHDLKGHPVWQHANPEYLSDILKPAENLIQEITDTPIDLNSEEASKNLLYDIAKIHWYLAHATPFYRGSAAVTETIIKGICLFHGLNITWEYKNIPRFLPDCESLITKDPEEFAKKYPDFSSVKPIDDTRGNLAKPAMKPY